MKTNKKHKLSLPSEDMKVRFESRFENGNLSKAIKISETEYNLILSYDYNTSGHTQWYYFKMMTQLPAGLIILLNNLATKIKLNILNLMKANSLYNEGMKPWVKSEKYFKDKGVEWYRDWTDITYTMNNYLK